MKRSLPVVVVTLALIAGACGDDDSSDDTTTDTPAAATDAPTPATDAPAPATDAPAATEPPPTEPAGTAATGSDDGEELSLATTDLGDVIVDDEGLTLYLFTPDAQGDASQCNDECADAWPPVAAVQSVEDGLDEALVGSITRADGTTQGTYNGWPLYYFSGDGGPGDVNGQGVSDVWWAVDASGNSIAG